MYKFIELFVFDYDSLFIYFVFWSGVTFPLVVLIKYGDGRKITLITNISTKATTVMRITISDCTSHKGPLFHQRKITSLKPDLALA